jgi:hypothetical protein
VFKLKSEKDTKKKKDFCNAQMPMTNENYFDGISEDDLFNNLDPNEDYYAIFPATILSSCESGYLTVLKNYFSTHTHTNDDFAFVFLNHCIECSFDNETIIRYLISVFAYLKVQIPWSTAIQVACEHHNFPFLKYLINCCKNDLRPIHSRFKRHNNSRWKKSFKVLIEYGNLDLVKYLLKESTLCGVPLNCKKYLYFAVMNHYTDIVHWILHTCHYNKTNEDDEEEKIAIFGEYCQNEDGGNAEIIRLLTENENVFLFLGVLPFAVIFRLLNNGVDKNFLCQDDYLASVVKDLECIRIERLKIIFEVTQHVLPSCIVKHVLDHLVAYENFGEKELAHYQRCYERPYEQRYKWLHYVNRES